MQNPHTNAVAQLTSVAKLLRPHYQDKKRFDAAIARLKQPMHVHETELVITMDDGSNKTFRAYRAQHDNSRGPFKGGIRFHPGVTREEVMALATWMTWKSAITGIPYGGGKGGVVVDPKTLSVAELERLSRAYARFVAPFIGAWVDVPAPDVNTTGQIMAWMVDEYEQYVLETTGTLSETPRAAFTGKPLALGGSQGREEATGMGGFFVLEEVVKKLGYTRKQEVTIAVQGFGNVGYWFAQYADAAGYKVVAVSDSKGGIYVENGLSPEKVLKCKQENGSVDTCMCTDAGCSVEHGTTITNEELLELPVDIVVPAALENVIDAKNASRIKAKVVLEMANGPTTPEADALLAQNNVLVIPDVLANAGGVTTSYFEWVQNLHGYYWSKDEVISKLQPLMTQAFAQLWEQRELATVDGRTAAYLGAVKQVIDALLLRGRV